VILFRPKKSRITFFITSKSNIMYNEKTGPKPPIGPYAPYANPPKDNPAIFKIPPGFLLTPHWHPNSNEITTCTGGKGQVTIISPNPNPKLAGNPGDAVHETYDLVPGQVVFLQQGYFHYFMNTGTEDFVINLTFDNPEFDILSLGEVLSLLPDNIKISAAFSDPKKLPPFIPYEIIK